MSVMHEFSDNEIEALRTVYRQREDISNTVAEAVLFLTCPIQQSAVLALAMTALGIARDVVERLDESDQE